MEYSKNDFTFKVLQATDTRYIEEAAKVLTDTFLGVKVGSSYVSEPMMVASGIGYEAFNSYLVDCLTQVAPQGLTVIALDNTTDTVVGAIVSEFSTGLVETTPLEGNLYPMNIVNLTTDRLINRYIRNLMNKGVDLGAEKRSHLFLIGVCLEFNKKYLAKDLGLYFEEVAREKGVKAVYTFASNYRSQGMFKNHLGYQMVYDIDKNIMVLPYCYEEAFQTIPSEIAVDGQLLEKQI